MPPRFNVLGVRVSAINPRDALDTIRLWIDQRQRRYVCVTGVHGVMESVNDPSLRAIHNGAGMVTPDGMPLVWLAWLNGWRRADRVYGPDLMLNVCGAQSMRNATHFLYGGGDGVAERLADSLRARIPGIRIAGTHTPPFRRPTPEEDSAAVDAINASNADIVWVGLSTPKQERWMAEHRSRLQAPVLIGVGAAFDFHAGLKRQAPRLIQRSGLEWLFRLCTEPRRLWRRYLSNNPRFIYHVLLQSAGVRVYN